MKGGNGGTIPPFLKRIGFVGPDGVPTELYKKFRNPANGGTAVAAAIKHGYKDLAQANEYFYQLPDKELLALIYQVTGAEKGNRVASLTLACIKALNAFADFETSAVIDEETEQLSTNNFSNIPPSIPSPYLKNERVGLNLSYTINLNLPATTDQAVFNAIFRSLKEHLLSGNE